MTNYSEEPNTIIRIFVFESKTLMYGSGRRLKVDVQEMTDSELYEMGFKVLANKLGASEVPRFIRQCQPGKDDYSVDRHKLLANQPDIDAIVKRIQDRQATRKS